MEELPEGRMVHYVMRGQANVEPRTDDGVKGQHRPAVVVKAHDEGKLDLLVCTRGLPDGVPSGVFNVLDVPYDDGTGSLFAPIHTWHWPENT